MKTEFTKEWIKNWRLINYPIKGKDTIKKYWFNEALNYIETQNERIAELEEALTKIASYESMRFKLSPYEYGLLEQIVGIAEHALRDGE